MILQGDALHLPLPDNSINLIITSPPYFAHRDYRDDGESIIGQVGSEPTPKEFLDSLIAATNEMKRVLRPDGSIFVNLGDKYAGSGGHNNSNIGAPRERGPRRYNQSSDGVRPKSLMGFPWRYALRCIDDLDLILRAEIVWEKPGGLPESVKDRVRRSHEQWFHLTKGPKYFTGIDEIREPYKGGGNNELGRLPGSVRTVNPTPFKTPDGFNGHYAAFPAHWPLWFIEGWAPKAICTICDTGLSPVTSKNYENVLAGGSLTRRQMTCYVCRCERQGPLRPSIVLDPFGGTGTTAMMARARGRLGISVDISMDYCKLARWRVYESGNWERPLQAWTKN